MPISKTIVTPNGMVQVSRVEQAVLKRKMVQTGEPLQTVFEVAVNMYGSLEDAKNNTCIVWQEYPVIAVPEFAAGSDPFEVVEKALIAASEKFEGGAYVPLDEVTSLETAKALKWEQIKAQRTALEEGGFDIAGVGRFDSNKESQSKILGASLSAKIASDSGQPYEVNWTLTDNTVALLDAAAMIDVGFKLLAHLDAAHQRSRALYTEIQAAETVEAVNAITWQEVQA